MKTLALLPLLLAIACGDKDAGQVPGGDDRGPERERSHGHAPKMGGVLIDLDHVVQLELVHEAGSDKLTVYVWDGHVEGPVRVKKGTIDFMLEAAGETLTVTCLPKANKLTGETEGDTATFEGTDPALKGVKRLKGTLMRMVARGQTWEGIEFDLPNDDQ